MKTSKYDMAYGRQGGRIVPWVPVGRECKVGETLIIEHDGIDTPVEVTRVHAGGRKVDVRFREGHAWTVAVSLLSEVPVHHMHRADDMDTAIAAAHSITDTLTYAQTQILKALAAAGEHGIFLGPVANGRWAQDMFAAADVVWLCADFAFTHPTHAGRRSSMPLAFWAIGQPATEALERLARSGVHRGFLAVAA